MCSVQLAADGGAADGDEQVDADAGVEHAAEGWCVLADEVEGGAVVAGDAEAWLCRDEEGFVHGGPRGGGEEVAEGLVFAVALLGDEVEGAVGVGGELDGGGVGVADREGAEAVKKRGKR